MRNVYYIQAKPAAELERDCNYGAIVIAENAAEARSLAATMWGDEPPETWTQSHLSKVSKLGIAANQSRSYIVLADFHAG